MQFREIPNGDLSVFRSEICSVGTTNSDALYTKISEIEGLIAVLHQQHLNYQVVTSGNTIARQFLIYTGEAPIGDWDDRKFTTCLTSCHDRSKKNANWL